MLEVLPMPKKRNLYFHKQVDQASIGDLTVNITEINQDDEYLVKLYAAHNLAYVPNPIRIFIDSYGGSVYQCFGLLSVMERSKTPIHTVVTGCAMSAGFMILISGHRRFAHRLSTPLYHQISTGFYGKAKDMEERMEETLRLQKLLEDEVINKTSITKTKLKEIYNSKTDWYMTSAEALKLGVVDEIL